MRRISAESISVEGKYNPSADIWDTKCPFCGEEIEMVPLRDKEGEIVAIHPFKRALPRGGIGESLLPILVPT